MLGSVAGPETPARAQVALRVSGVSKRFGATQALTDVSLEIGTGSIHALVGRNGAGKSTLVSIITGNTKPDEGVVEIPGLSADTATSAVAAVFQKIRLSPYLSVAENLQLGLYPRQIIRWKEVRQRAQATLDQWHLDVPVETPVNELRLDQQQVVSIARALAAGAKTVILDEPTARLDWHETEELFANIRSLSSQHGVSFLFISHSLAEVFALCDHVTVLRDGAAVADGPTSELDEQALVSAMVGSRYELATRRAMTDSVGREIAVSVRDMEIQGAVQSASFDIRKGECLGVASLVGGGAIAIAEALVGYRRAISGTVEIFGTRQPLGRRDVSVAAGVGFVPADRNASGLVPEQSVRRNISLAALGILSRFGVVDRGAETRVAFRNVTDLGIVIGDLDQEVRELSGGNQQKVVIGRAASIDPRVVIVANPTVGVDIASKDVIYGWIKRAVESGVSVLIASEDELGDLDLCSRVLVIFDGEISREFGPERTQEEILSAIEGVASGRNGGPAT